MRVMPNHLRYRQFKHAVASLTVKIGLIDGFSVQWVISRIVKPINDRQTIQIQKEGYSVFPRVFVGANSGLILEEMILCSVIINTCERQQHARVVWLWLGKMLHL